MGCAVGDSLGLPFENLPPRRIDKWLAGRELKHSFVFGYGMVSDDTEHSLMVARCLRRHPDDPQAFKNALGGELKYWLWGCPAGIGFATLRSILKLCVGVSPDRSGVFSAGNGPAMRSAVIGCMVPDDPVLRRSFVEASSQITHTDPKATYGAVAVAEIAAKIACGDWTVKPDAGEVEKVLREITPDSEWQEVVDQTCLLMQEGSDLTAYGGRKGVSGYVYHTVPFAIACWYRYFGEFEKTVEASIRGGGDADSTTAVCGSLAGISGYPEDMANKILFWPVDISHFSVRPNLLRIWLRNLFFFLVILAHCVRRCFPPY